MSRIKHIVFVSRSRLAHNLLGLFTQTSPKQIQCTCFVDFSSLAESNISHTVHLMIVDHAVFLEGKTEHEISQILQGRFFKQAKKILLHGRHDQFDETHLRENGFCHFLAKPFLPEEMIGLIQRCLKG